MAYPTTVFDGVTPNRDAGQRKSPNWQDWNVVIRELIATQTRVDNNETGKDDVALDSVGILATVPGLSVVEKGDGAMHKTVITFDGVELDTTDGAVPATDGMWGTLLLYTFPVGHIFITASHAVFPLGDLVATVGGGGGLSDTADLELGVGSVAAANASAFGLNAGTEEDLIAGLDVDLVAGASDAIESVAQVVATAYDGTAAALTANLNLRTLDDADAGVLPDILVVSGVLTLIWTSIGDN